MKKIITAIAITGLLCEPITAQQLRAYIYIAEGHHYYHIVDAMPGSNIAFYSQRGGGKLLKNMPVDDNGFSLYKVDGNAPAMVVNSSNVSSGKSGGGKVVHFADVREFEIDNFKLERKSDKNIVSWHAAVTDLNAYEFVILKSNDGVKFEKIRTIVPQSNSFISYFFEDNADAPITFYQVHISGIKNEVRYTSNPMKIVKEHLVMVYPTLFENKLHIDLSNTSVNDRYSIINTQGQEVQSGKLTGNNTIIKTADLASGMYFIKIVNGTSVVSKPMIKK